MIEVVLVLLFFVLYDFCLFIYSLSLLQRLKNTSLRIRARFQAATAQLQEFIESFTPIGRDPAHLERDIVRTRRMWLASPYHQQLTELITRIVSDRLSSSISNVVSLGIGAGGYRDYQQFVVFQQIVNQLAEADPEVLDNVVIQDPDMIPGMRTLFEQQGWRVVDDPAAFELVGPNTFLLSAYVSLDPLAEGLENRPVDQLALFIGNGDELKEMVGPGGIREDIERYGSTINAMLDETTCSHEDLPCDRPNGKSYGAEGQMSGLSSFDVWWRPART